MQIYPECKVLNKRVTQLSCECDPGKCAWGKLNPPKPPSFLGNERCQRCTHTRSTHEVTGSGAYQPYGHCNHGYDLCGCSEFLPSGVYADQP